MGLCPFAAYAAADFVGRISCSPSALSFATIIVVATISYKHRDIHLCSREETVRIHLASLLLALLSIGRKVHKITCSPKTDKSHTSTLIEVCLLKQMDWTERDCEFAN